MAHADEIVWKTPSDLGTLYNGAISELSVYAVNGYGNELTYTIISPSNTFPPNLTFTSNGHIVGRAAFEISDQIDNINTARTYTFFVQADDPNHPTSHSVKAFTFTVVKKFNLPYDNLYIKALLPLDDRAKIRELLYNDNIIPRSQLYRVEDSYFGVTQNVTFQHTIGVPSVASSDLAQSYMNAVNLNHYSKRITLGELKTAVARDNNNNIVYEVVYSQIIDDQVMNGKSISKIISWPQFLDLNLNNWVSSLLNTFASYTHTDTQYQPVVKRFVSTTNGFILTLNSVENLELKMNLLPVMNSIIQNDSRGLPPEIVAIDAVNNTVTINVQQNIIGTPQLLFQKSVYTSLTPGLFKDLTPNSLENMRQQIYSQLGQINDISLLPTWMRSLQADKTIPGYTPAWVICYTKPGYSASIKNNIETLWPYKLNEINFEIDRFIVDRSKTYNYQGTDNNGAPIWTTIPSAQPNVIDNSKDSYVYFPKKTIKSDETQ